MGHAGPDLGRNCVDFEIGIAFQLFDVTHILAYAVTFILVMLAVETFLMQPIERHVSRWRAGRGNNSKFPTSRRA